MLRGWLEEIRSKPNTVLHHLVEITRELSLTTDIDGVALLEIQCALRHLRAAQRKIDRRAG